jgi:hypothetical protein
MHHYLLDMEVLRRNISLAVVSIAGDAISLTSNLLVKLKADIISGRNFPLRQFNSIQRDVQLQRSLQWPMYREILTTFFDNSLTHEPFHHLFTFRF